MDYEFVSLALKNCIPYKFFQLGDQTLCRWLTIDDGNFTDPFFEETVSGYLKKDVHFSSVKCVSSPDVLPEWAEQITTIEPTAFIFHVSRCGSTLISQLLSLADENIVLSEVPFFDNILRDKTMFAGETNRTEMLRAAMRFYGAKRTKKQSQVFIKTDSWHILFYKQLRALYPAVPFILLYRDPVEVIRSQQKRRGMHAAPGIIEPELFGFNSDAITMLSLDEYMAKVLEVYFQHFINIAKKDPLAYPVNYNEGAITIVKKIAGITSMPIDTIYMETMIKRSAYHAKYPETLFNEELQETGLVVDCKNVVQLYETLEGIRIDAAVHIQNELV